jgi:hypothetical protein
LTWASTLPAGLGIGHEDLLLLQPLLQHRVRKHFEPGEGPERLAAVIGELSAEDDRVNIERQLELAWLDRGPCCAAEATSERNRPGRDQETDSGAVGF